MKNSTKFAVTLALILASVMVVAGGADYSSPAEAAALPFAGTPGIEKPVRATKGDRLDIRPKIREIAGVTMVLRDFDLIVR